MKRFPVLGSFVVVLGIYLSAIVILTVIYTSYEVITNVIPPHINERAVLDDKVVRGMESVDQELSGFGNTV